MDDVGTRRLILADERTAWATGADTPIMLSTPSADTAFTVGGNPPTATTTEVAVIG